MTLKTEAMVIGIERHRAGAWSTVQHDHTTLDGQLMARTTVAAIYRDVTVEGEDRPAVAFASAVGLSQGGEPHTERLELSATACHVYSECAHLEPDPHRPRGRHHRRPSRPDPARHGHHRQGRVGHHRSAARRQPRGHHPHRRALSRDGRRAHSVDARLADACGRCIRHAARDVRRVDARRRAGHHGRLDGIQSQHSTRLRPYRSHHR
ncbi:hypothetical protein LP417_22200 [Polaromonas sp. P1-6]|nr:hypothetical protein LP417_22200 [Polaromonas sp. P1-6]